MQPKIGFVGMTHLGLVSGISAAEKGFHVVCFDPDLRRIGSIKQGVLPVSEPQLNSMLVKNKQHILFSADISALQDCDVDYVAPDVATDNQGDRDLNQINTTLATTLEGVRSDAVVVILSQVPPGFTRSKQQEGRELYYQVETLIFGRAVERALYPERIIIGCVNPDKPLPIAYKNYLIAYKCPILPMRFESAELAKISINMYLVASVTVANTLAELCERIGANWSEIIPALKLDQRIGPYAYLTPGLGIAGGNLERDLATVCRYADKYNTDAGVVRAWIANSRHRRDWVLSVLQREILCKLNNPIISILGLTYKQDTDSIKNSPSIALINNLSELTIRVFDPVVDENVVLSSSCYFASSELEACDSADVLVIMTPWSQFSKLNPADIAEKLRGNLIIDPYAVLDAKVCCQIGLSYHTLGFSELKS